MYGWQPCWWTVAVVVLVDGGGGGGGGGEIMGVHIGVVHTIYTFILTVLTCHRSLP